MSEKHSIHCPARDIPVRAEVDVLVVGGGPAGIMAAEAAAGDGLRVMLVESRGFLGGNLTIGLPILGFLGRKGNQIIEGSAQRFIDRLRARGAASEHRPCALHMSLTIIDPEEAKRTALEIMEEKGVEVLLYVFCTDVVKEGDDVKGVIIESKAGREAILAKTVIDCTGDGDVAFRAGVECRKGDAEDVRWMEASASMPLAAKIVQIGHYGLLDGGVADSIPVRFFESLGYKRNLIILTQPKGFVKKKNPLLPAIRARYLRYPAFVAAVADRHERYNEALSYIAMQEASGKDYVIRPPIPLEIGAMERDPAQLRRVYETGRAVAENQIDKIAAFLNDVKEMEE